MPGSASTRSALERGRRIAPRPCTLALLASALNLSPEERAVFVAAATGEPTTQPITAPARAASVATLLAPPTPLIGRERETATVCELLRRPGVRLVTLRGPGGVGKTRLALAVARALAPAFADGAALVSLAAVRDPALVAPTLATALAVAEEGDRPPMERLKVYLRDRELLLVVDNLEQVLDAAPLLTELLATCPHLAMLATSRTTLRLRGEHVYTVPSLSFPRGSAGIGPQQLLQYPAAALFVERVRAAQPNFVLDEVNTGCVAAICACLEGLPLAIELAAARIPLLPPDKGRYLK